MNPEDQQNSPPSGGASTALPPAAQVSEPQSPPEELPEETLDLEALATEATDEPIELRPVDRVREEAAVLIAKTVLWIFGISVTLSFVVVIALITMALVLPEPVVKAVLAVMGGNALEALKVTGGLFSPFLAFILGYYFSVPKRDNK